MLNANNNYRFYASGNWDATALLTMYTKLAALDLDYIEDCNAAIAALTYYGKEVDGEFAGFSDSWAETPFGSSSGGCYDDNMWVGRDLVSLYEITGDSRFLDMAIRIADFLIADAWQELDEGMFADYFGIAPQGAFSGVLKRSLCTPAQLLPLPSFCPRCQE